VALFALFALLLYAALRGEPGRGFRAQSFPGRDGCGAGATPGRERVVSEPFLREGQRPEGCERFTAFAVVERRRLTSFELVSLGSARLRVDGRLLVQLRATGRLGHAQGELWLARGVHTLEVEQQHGAGPSYLRVHEDDLADSHFKYGLPPLESQRYFVDRGRAQAALDAGHAPARPGRALLAFLAWVLAAACIWLASRARHDRALPLSDFAIACALTVVALFVRVRGIPRQDVAWDELTYTLAGRHFVRNLQLGDFAREAFRYNYYHPPLAKWLYGLGYALGAQDGARMVSAVLSAASIGLCYGVGKLLFGRRVGFGAAAIAAWLPGLVAHARLSGLESVLVFFWLLSLLASLCWLRAVEAEAGEPGAAYVPAFFSGACAALACGARLTAVWIAPLSLLVLVLPRRLSRGLRAR